ncbi:MAG: hypothetical protein KJ015_05915 [Myxococcales bacterium]|nr:hypothetical protein [Myxococcales bacterium]
MDRLGDIDAPQMRNASAEGETPAKLCARLCYTLSMKRKKNRRSGATETFSVSVDAKTKRALRALADKEFGGNLSALVTDLAEEARRRLAAGAYLSRHRIPSLTPDQAAELEGEIAREVAGAKHRGRGGKAA